MNSSSVHIHLDKLSQAECKHVVMSSRDFVLRSTDGAEDWEYIEKDESQTSLALIRLVSGELKAMEFNDISLRRLRTDEEKRFDAGTTLTGVDAGLYGPVGLE